MPDDERTHLRNRVSWGAILAGVALVVQLLLNILGIGVGASPLNAANTGDHPTVSGISLTAGIWWTLSGTIASFIGGIVAGRLCGTSDSNTARWHDFVSWRVAALVIVCLLTSAVGRIIGSTISAAGKDAASAVSGVAQNTNGDAVQSQSQRMVNPNSAQSTHDDIMAYIRASVSGDQAGAMVARDRAVDSLARTANSSLDEARTRLQQAEQQARQAAEATRKGVAGAGLAGFVALALGAWRGGSAAAACPGARWPWSRRPQALEYAASERDGSRTGAVTDAPCRGASGGREPGPLSPTSRYRWAFKRFSSPEIIDFRAMKPPGNALHIREMSTWQPSLESMVQCIARLQSLGHANDQCVICPTLRVDILFRI